ncbi:TIR domain-containing protein [Sphingorhabdus sp. Alg231-15]|uniref:TIR domain-containing protein n=1 Tax=Sphingorhabdus sp. Alg231-15 TaxID=1922222 RepID=UPI000D54C287
MGQEPATQLFISHHSSKLPVALELEKSLAKYGVTCWLAPRDVEPSEAFDMAIKRAIDESCATLLLFCSKSDKSPHVKRELILADSSRKAIIPVRLEELAPDELAYHLASFQWIDWLEQRESTIERVAAKAHQLAGTVQKTMTVEDLIEHSGKDNADETDAGTISDQPEEPEPAEAVADPEPEPIHEEYEDEWEPEKPKTNWALIAALAALTVATIAVFLIWNASGSENPLPPTEPAELPVEPVDDADDEVVEPEPEVEAKPVVPKPLPPDGPSFDCTKASQRVEFLICNTPQLAKLDRTLSSVYKDAMSAAGPNAPRLQRQQRAWRTETRDRCPDTACVATAVRERLAILRAIAAGNLDVPRDPPRPAFRSEFSDAFDNENERAFEDNGTVPPEQSPN